MAARKKTGNWKTEKIPFLKNISILKGITQEQLETVAAICKDIVAKEGEVLMKEGEPGDTMYLFVSGEVEFSTTATLKIPKKGFETAESIGGKLNASFVPFFGHMAIFEDAPRSATIRALKDCALYEIHKDDFYRICDEDNNLGYILLRNMIPILCGNIRSANETQKKLTTLLTIVLSKKR